MMNKIGLIALIIGGFTLLGCKEEVKSELVNVLKMGC